MKTTSTIVPALLCIVVAAVTGQVMCAPLKSGVLLNPQVFSIMVVFSCTSFVVFSVARRIPSPLAQLLAGIGGSYLVLAGTLFVFAAIKGETAEAMLWLPALIVYGIPLTAPLVGLSWLASALAFGPKRN